MSEGLSYIAWIAAGIAGGYLVLRAFWWLKSGYQLRRAGPRPFLAGRHRLWRDPGEIERLDMVAGPGGRGMFPAPPFHFGEEHSTGTQPCVSVHDARGRRWRVKWGPEVPCETFAVRLAWACGYYAEITHRIAGGSIEGCGPLSRAAHCVAEGGAFNDARFEL